MQCLPDPLLQRSQQQGESQDQGQSTSRSRESETQAARRRGGVGRYPRAEDGELASRELSVESAYASPSSSSPSPSPSRPEREEIRGEFGVGGSGMGEDVGPPSSFAIEARLRSPTGQRETGTTSWESTAEAIPPQFVGADSEAHVDGVVKPRRRDFAFPGSSSPWEDTYAGDERPLATLLSPTWTTQYVDIMLQLKHPLTLPVSRRCSKAISHHLSPLQAQRDPDPRYHHITLPQVALPLYFGVRERTDDYSRKGTNHLSTA